MKTKLLFISIVLLILFTRASFVGNKYKINSKQSKLLIIGTSSIRDWEMEASNVECSSELLFNDLSLDQILNINFSCKVEDIRSHNKIMNKKTWKALNRDEFPSITFSMETPVALLKSDNDFNITGQLTIAGKTNNVNISCKIEHDESTGLRVFGEVPLKMTDFGVKPPTALMGILKTGDYITIKYEFDFSQVNP